jgi:hypothetical protein
VPRCRGPPDDLGAAVRDDVERAELLHRVGELLRPLRHRQLEVVGRGVHVELAGQVGQQRGVVVGDLLRRRDPHPGLRELVVDRKQRGPVLLPGACPLRQRLGRLCDLLLQPVDTGLRGADIVRTGGRDPWQDKAEREDEGGQAAELGGHVLDRKQAAAASSAKRRKSVRSVRLGDSRLQ